MIKRKALAAILITTVVFMSSVGTVVAASSLLKKESRGSKVTALQKDLIKLGYLNCAATGYYGDLTVNAVKKFQKDYGLHVDGIAGSKTLGMIENLKAKSAASKSSTERGAVLKPGSRGEAVAELQRNLAKLGYFNETATGYYGTVTKEAVKKLQKAHGYDVDGIAGEKTLALISKLLSSSSTDAAVMAATAEKSESAKSTEKKKAEDYMLKWYGNVEKLFAIGKTAKAYDIESGLSFNIKRTYGHNHADCETLTADDTAIMKKIYGGSWSWNRRAIILTVGDTKIAASMAGMPHAGRDKYSANKVISSRSGGYGRGTNLDAVKNNNMNGVFDVHFLGSKTHGTKKVDSKHQAAIKQAAKWAEKNL
jgi:peptidoglycan hydrolase-like protein with peptidoglycan-binding domain